MDAERGSQPALEWARFDDLTSGAALVWPRPRQVLVARRAEEVRPVLAEVERACAQGAWACGYLAYEAAAGLDPALPVKPPPEGLPLVWFALCAEPTRGQAVAPPRGLHRDYTAGPWRPGWTEAGYRRGVARVRAHIAAGESYQCNLTVRLRAHLTGRLDELYADLAWSQGGAYNAYLDTGSHIILSASPEMFFVWSGDRLVTRPMKGTAVRGRTVAEDAAQAAALLASPKERAENVMIVDLIRNDLARLAQTGSVQVPVLWALERYETVWQLTSTVQARTDPAVGLSEVFTALFPSGSVTGAPKQRTMALIRDLETEPRGVYCGAIGMLAPPGHRWRARFSVAIRTVVADRASGEAVYGTGGGITWGSEPSAEHAELLAKAAILGPVPEEFELIETLAYLPGHGLRHLQRHLNRLADSAEYFGFRWDPALVRGQLQAAADAAAGAGPGRTRVRLLLARSGTATISIGPLEPGPPGPVTLALDTEPSHSGSRWLFHKTTRRQVYLARAARHPDVQDVVGVNERGELTETTIANLAVRLDRRWYTPAADAGLLAGIERGWLLELGRLTERRLTPTDLVRAEGLAVVNSLRGWRPAVLAGPVQSGPRQNRPRREPELQAPRSAGRQS